MSERSSGTGRGTGQVRSARNSSGQSNASAWTSCGNARVAAPVSAGFVSTRIAASEAGITCSGREIRSKYRETGRNESLTETSPAHGTSSCWSTGSGACPAKMSPGRSSTGSRFTVASAAPVSMFVAPGPIELVHTRAPSRFRIRA